MISSWLENLPSGWEAVALKRVVDLRNTRSTEIETDEFYIGLENIESWTGRLRPSIPMLNESEEENTSKATNNRFEAGDVLFGKLRPYLAKAYLAREAGICTTELLVFIPRNNLDARFLLNVLLTREFIGITDAETFGVRMPRADWNTIGNIPVPIPLVSLQNNIANYLDRETAKLDAMISAKEELLELLVEKRRALITHAVTRGLNPNVRLRDSGVEWLGEIPEHWQVEYARWLFREVDERSTTGEEELLTVSHLTGVTSRAEKDVNMFLAESMEGYKICRRGDLVINTLWAWMGAMGIAFLDGIVSPAYNVYRSLGEFDPRYIDYLVRMPVFAQEVIRYSKGVWSSRLRLYPEEFFQVILTVPPLSEQKAIADYLDMELKKIDSLANVAQETIDLLRERRTALIAAAVTGKIHIPA